MSNVAAAHALPVRAFMLACATEKKKKNRAHLLQAATFGRRGPATGSQLGCQVFRAAPHTVAQHGDYRSTSVDRGLAAAALPVPPPAGPAQHAARQRIGTAQVRRVQVPVALGWSAAWGHLYVCRVGERGGLRSYEYLSPCSSITARVKRAPIDTLTGPYD
jgi:hypothetical protein